MSVFVLDKRQRLLMPCTEKLLKRIKAQAKAPLKDATAVGHQRKVAQVGTTGSPGNEPPGHRTQSSRINIARLYAGGPAVNITRWALFIALKATGFPVTTGSGGLTKFNRSKLGIPKAHALDAACVGITHKIEDWNQATLGIKATGRGSYQRTRLDAHGFPRGYLTRSKRIKGFQTGDMVRAHVEKGQKVGVHVGRVAVRATGSFNIQTTQDLVQGISYRLCKAIQRANGYGYSHILALKGGGGVSGVL